MTAQARAVLSRPIADVHGVTDNAPMIEYPWFIYRREGGRIRFARRDFARLAHLSRWHCSDDSRCRRYHACHRRLPPRRPHRRLYLIHFRRCRCALSGCYTQGTAIAIRSAFHRGRSAFHPKQTPCPTAGISVTPLAMLRRRDRSCSLALALHRRRGREIQPSRAVTFVTFRATTGLPDLGESGACTVGRILP